MGRLSQGIEGEPGSDLDFRGEDEDIAIRIFDLELTPGQHRNLERELEMPVIDRTALILIIFGQRARTKAASAERTQCS